MEKVKFKQLQALKGRAYAAFAKGERLEVPEQDASRLDPISLAFVGDAYYALYLRRRLVQTGIPNVQVLHLLASEFVSAKARRRRARPSPSITTARRWKPWWDT